MKKVITILAIALIVCASAFAYREVVIGANPYLWNLQKGEDPQGGTGLNIGYYTGKDNFKCGIEFDFDGCKVKNLYKHYQGTLLFDAEYFALNTSRCFIGVDAGIGFATGRSKETLGGTAPTFNADFVTKLGAELGVKFGSFTVAAGCDGFLNVDLAGDGVIWRVAPEVAFGFKF